MTAPPVEALVRFPLVGGQAAGLAMVKVLSWGRVARGDRFTKAGGNAHDLGKAEEIEAIVRAERLYGHQDPQREHPEHVVELELPAGTRLSGTSYGLALALADRGARGGLPNPGGRALIASGHVEHDGRISAIGGLQAKLSLIAQHLGNDEHLAAPVLMLPRANVERADASESAALAALTARGVAVIALERLDDARLAADPGGPFALPLADHARPGTEAAPRRAWTRISAARWLLAAAMAGVGLLAFAGVRLLDADRQACAAADADSTAAARCWQVAGLDAALECRWAEGDGWSPWQPCSSGECLGPRDKFRLRLSPSRDGWLYAWHRDDDDATTTSLLPSHAHIPVRGGASVLIPEQGQSMQWSGDARYERFFALLSARPIAPMTGPDAPLVRARLTPIAQQLLICHDLP